jgi:hypothetical protein
MLKEMEQNIMTPPPDLPLGLTRVVRPLVADRIRDCLAAALKPIAGNSGQRVSGDARAPMQSASNGDWHVPLSVLGGDAADALAGLQDIVGNLHRTDAPRKANGNKRGTGPDDQRGRAK